MNRSTLCIAAGLGLVLTTPGVTIAQSITVTEASASATLVVVAEAPSDGSGAVDNDNRFDSTTTFNPVFIFNDAITASAIDAGTPEPPEDDAFAPFITTVGSDAQADASLNFTSALLDQVPGELGFDIVYGGNTSAQNNGDALGSAFASAEFSARFVLQEQANFFFQFFPNIDPAFDKDFKIELINRDRGGATIISVQPGDSEIELESTLDPGTYTFDFLVSQESVANDFAGSGFASQSNSLNTALVIEVVPEPATSTMLAGLGLLVARRRRS